MSYAAYLRELLAPLRVYDLTAPFNGGELDSAGMALDGLSETLEEITRESCLATAESWGLEQMAGLLVRRPVASAAGDMAGALAALLRISGDSFTLESINDTLRGCGVPAKVVETEVGMVIVHFPGIAGVPEGFEEMKGIIEDILPAHVGIKYCFWYLTWAELESMFPSWNAIENRALTWGQLQVSMVE